MIDQSDSTNLKTDLKQYYARRAAEYEVIYAKPERQVDLAAMKLAIAEAFQGRSVVEIACGTGWWSSSSRSTAFLSSKLV